MSQNPLEPIVIEKKPKCLTLRLRGDLNIGSAAHLHAGALGLLDEEADVVVACGELGRLDTSILQVLLALGQTLQSYGRNLRLADVPPHLKETLAAAALSNEFSVGRIGSER